MTDVDSLYSARFSKSDVERKNRVWQVLCRDFFQHYLRPSDTVVDVGAGYCEFINHIECRKKYAVDLSDDTRRFANEEVIVLKTESTDLSALEDESADVVFASNFFEHLESKAEVLATLREIHRVLRVVGKLLILQPNIKYLRGDYWDFFDHLLPLSHVSMMEALELSNFTILEVRPKFLPATTKSALPQHPLLVALYLKLPIVQRIMGKQMFIVAMKEEYQVSESPEWRVIA